MPLPNSTVLLFLMPIVTIYISLISTALSIITVFTFLAIIFFFHSYTTRVLISTYVFIIITFVISPVVLTIIIICTPCAALNISHSFTIMFFVHVTSYYYLVCSSKQIL